MDTEDALDAADALIIEENVLSDDEKCFLVAKRGPRYTHLNPGCSFLIGMENMEDWAVYWVFGLILHAEASETSRKANC